MSQNKHTAKKPRAVYILTLGNGDGENQRLGVYGTLQRGLDAMVEVINTEILGTAKDAVVAHIQNHGPITASNSPVLYLNEDDESVYPENDWVRKAYPLPTGWKGTPIAEMGTEPHPVVAHRGLLDYAFDPVHQRLRNHTFTVNAHRYTGERYEAYTTVIRNNLPHYKADKRLYGVVKSAMEEEHAWPGVGFVLRWSDYTREVVTLEQVVVE